MTKLYLFFVIAIFNVGCSAEKSKVTRSEDQKVVVGAAQFDSYLNLLNEKRVGLTVNQTSVVEETHLVDTLLSLDVNISAVYTPEHGFKGTLDAGETIENQNLEYSFRVESLYGKNKKPSANQLEGIDIMIFDIQDVGVRFYTYISTMHYVMQACAENNIPLIILDRPNPNGSYVDGPVLDTAFRSFVGMHPIPIVHGLTIGELAQMIIGENWLETSKNLDLTIIPVQNWTHSESYSLPVRPSPNLPNDLSIALYPSLCLFEGTQVSIGRGTEFPFQIFGHPDLEGDFSFTPTSSFGAKYPKLQDEICFGHSFLGSEIKYEFTLKYLLEAYNKLGNEDYFKDYFSLLIGNDITMNQILKGMSEEEIRTTWSPGLDDFKKSRMSYLLYK